MAQLARQRCRNHAVREAVARCMSCRDFFCRECVVEHESRMTCKDCLEAATKTEAARDFSLVRQLVHTAMAAASFIICYLVFYMLHRYLAMISSAFYELRSLF